MDALPAGPLRPKQKSSMGTQAAETEHSLSADLLAQRYRKLRARSLTLCSTLEREDFVVQSMPDVSPTKWHLAHTTWLFERFILSHYIADYRVFHQRYDYLFNSYYQTIGKMHPRAERGLLSRPTVAEIRDYRAYVDRQMSQLLDTFASAELAFLVELGLNHEQQHQELLLTDIKHILSCNPLKPAFRQLEPAPVAGTLPEASFLEIAGGVYAIGATGNAFCFDNETPGHDEVLIDCVIANRLVSNREYRQFIDDGGYKTPDLWLSDGWIWTTENAIERPLYWSEDLGTEFTLGGSRTIDPNAPVCHVSFYEADAFARWAGARLPTEAEWEVVARRAKRTGNLMDDGLFQPVRLGQTGDGPHQIYGDVWEWTSSPYRPYPGFKPLAGALGEYNAKFMCNQMVVRGGSCVTPADHIRATYRNFFYPHQRWQFFGIRLAKDTC